MANKFSRRFIIGALLTSVANVTLAETPVASRRPARTAVNFQKMAVKEADALIAAAGLAGKISFVVADAGTGLVLETEKPQLPLPPASVVKIITSLYALENLGAGYQFKTRLLATGPVVNGRLKGDLVLVGGGDPTLDTNHLAEMAAALKRAGVRSITGKFQVNSRMLPYVKSIDASQPEHLGYSTSVSGLNLNFNRVYFEWKPNEGSYDVTMDARTRKYRPRVAMAKMRIVDRKLPAYTYSDAGGVDNWTVARQILGKGGGRWLPVRKPHLYAAEVFQTMARSQGIKLPPVVATKTVTRGTVLVEHKSAKLRVLLRAMLKYSNNMTAESIGLMTSVSRGGPINSLKASAKKMTRWNASQTGTRKSRFVDHSGLGAGSRLTTDDMVAALVKHGAEGKVAQSLKQVALRDSDGRVMKDHPVKVHAKTGTLNFVSALAGYISTPDGTKLAFAIFAADEKHRAGLSKRDREAPKGRKRWNRASKRLQQQLIQRWATLYSG